MSAILNLLGALGLVASFAGYGLAVRRKLDVDMCFVPAVVLCAAGCIVYLGGIVGLLVPAAWAVLLGGIAALGFDAWRWVRDPSSRPHPHASMFGVCFALGALLFLSMLPGEHLEHYDNFSHWATAVKVLLSTGAFPTADNGLIEFFNYPLGTTSLIFYICLFAGHAEGTMLLAQGLLIFALFLAVFGMLRHKKSFLLFAALGAGCSVLSLFNVTIRINNLLVDFILPLGTMAAWAIVDRYHETPGREAALLVPILAFLGIVKSTGVVFVAFALLYAGARALSDRRGGAAWCRGKRWWAGCAATLLASLSTFLAWQWHMKTALAGVQSKFDVAAAASNAVSGGKTPEEIGQVVAAFWQAACDLSTRPALGIVVLNAVAIVAIVVLRAARGVRLRRLARDLAALDVMVAAYYAGILAMYVFSMPLDEALTVAGFDRYACSIVALFAGGLAMGTAAELESHLKFSEEGLVVYGSPTAKRDYQRSILACLALAVGLLTSEYNGMLYNAQDYEKSLPALMQQVTGDRWYTGDQEDQTRYLFYGSDTDGRMTSYYFTYVARYYMYAPHIDAICAFYEDNMDNLLSGYDELCVVEPDAAEQALLKKHYGVDGSAGFYRVLHNDDGSVALEKVADS